MSDRSFVLVPLHVGPSGFIRCPCYYAWGGWSYPRSFSHPSLHHMAKAGWLVSQVYTSALGLLTLFRPLHTWDWEPVTITLRALSLVGKGGAHGPISLPTKALTRQPACNFAVHARKTCRLAIVNHFTPILLEPPHERQEVPHYWQRLGTKIRRERVGESGEDGLSGPRGGHHRISWVSGGNPLVVPMA